MKFIKKHYKLIITIIVILLIFLIFKLNNKNNQNYTSLGDGYSLGKNSYGQIDYGYSDYFKDYLSTNNYLNRYIKSFSVETMTINSLIDNISINKKIVLNNKEYNLKQTLRESTILTLSIGLNDLIYQMSLSEELTDSTIDKIISNIKKDYKKLIREIKKYYQYDIYIVGYYSVNTNNYLNKGIRKLNNIYRNDKEVIYIDTYTLFESNKSYRSRSQSIYPNNKGYEAISRQIVLKASKKLENSRNNWYTNNAFNYYD